MSHNTEPIREPFPPRWVFLVAALMIIAGLAWNVYMQVSTTADKNTAQANSKTLAQDIQTICEAQGKLLVDDRDLCAKATQVQKEPTDAIAGPKGEPGTDGKDGIPGSNGVDGINGPPGKDGGQGPAGPSGPMGQPGPAGAAGPVGANGPPGVAGPAGPQGEPGAAGADSTVAGPAGPAGATGPQGPQGEEGRGVRTAYCGDDGRWLMTYTDGATSDGGECRAPTGPPIGLP